MLFSATMNTPSPEKQAIESEVLLRSLDQAPLPITGSQLRDRLTGPYKLPLDKIEQLLERLVEEGKAHRYPAIGRSRHPRYWTHGIEHYGREMILKALATRSLTMSDLLRRLRSSLKGLEEAAQRQLVIQLVREKALHEWPPMIGGRTSQYGVQPPAPRVYLEDAMRKIANKLGVSREALAGAARELGEERPAPLPKTQGNLDENLLQRMVQIKLAAAQGAPLSLQELWHSLQSDGWEKATFDRIVLELAKNYRVALLKHDFPGILSEQERNDLVVDAFGNYYVGIALR